jgi:hypothetical protein
VLLAALLLSSGCRTIGNVLLPPHPESGWDEDSKVFVRVTDGPEAGQLVSRYGGDAALVNRFRGTQALVGADEAIGIALEALGKLLEAEAKRYDTSYKGSGSAIVDVSAVCGQKPLGVHSPTPDRGVRCLSPAFIAIERKSPVGFYRRKKDTLQDDFLLLLQIVPYPEVSAMVLVPTFLSVQRTHAKVPAIHWKRPWGFLLPWMWIFEIGARTPWTGWHDVKISPQLELEGIGFTEAIVIQQQARPDEWIVDRRLATRDPRLSLGAVEIEPERVNVRKLPFKRDKPKDLSRPFLAWPIVGKIALNLRTQVKEKNEAGAAIAYLGGLLGKKSGDIAKEISNLAGFAEPDAPATPAPAQGSAP